MDIKLRVAKPFQTLDELYDGLDNLEPWPRIFKLRESTEYVYTINELNDKGEIVKLSKLDRDQQPRTILCHDMKGGYLQDKFVDGSNAHDSYLFYHWSIVDVFIYFSHYLVTIPPYGWINAAHNYGVKVLGTVITEGIVGEYIWEKVLFSIEETKRFADALILLAKFYNFEGWLLNVENKIKPENIERLLYFIKYLTTEIHSQIQDAEIIWYDSVTIDGDLKWQNELNDKNKCFLENCDGIFLNYNWTDSGLEKSKILGEQMGKMRNIYVGLDVWGRGCPGGGGFNSIEALRNIRKYNLSVAIFGPAWTHEYFNGEAFQNIENIFWAQLSSLMCIHVPIYENEKFTTSFCRGSGKYYYKSGICNKSEYTSFYNLSQQQTQISLPAINLKFTYQDEKIVNHYNNKNEKSIRYIYETRFHIIIVHGNTITLEEKHRQPNENMHYANFTGKFAYDGGGCLELVTEDPFQSYHRLFLIHLEFDSDIQIFLIHKKHNSSLNGAVDNSHSVALDSPTLILINNNTELRLTPYKNFTLKEKWRQSNYHAFNMKSVNEIGVMFIPEGRYYIGKIEVHPYIEHS